MKHRELLELIEYVPPGPHTSKHLDAVPNHKRYIDLSSFKRSHTVLNGQEIMLCGWCNVVEVKGKTRKYCSSNCRESAHLYCYPQSPANKMWIFINRQDCTCLRCGEIFEDELEKKLLERDADNKESHRKWGSSYGWKLGPVTYFQLGVGTGHKWQTDHIVPLRKGGRGIGLDNIQIICTNCHYKKTAADLKTP